MTQIFIIKFILSEGPADLKSQRYKTLFIAFKFQILRLINRLIKQQNNYYKFYCKTKDFQRKRLNKQFDSFFLSTVLGKERLYTSVCIKQYIINNNFLKAI